MKELIPAGSVVLLKNAVKRLMIIGVLQQKKTELIEGIPAVYDYIGVPYPEGYIGADSAFLFNREDIEEIVFTGYDDEEREGFLEILSKVYDSARDVIENA
ncbi:MAG: DUF4176 domain-containing protein [Oscillospiraceae bacterium]|nr:DUF4176 domain-containing protein [Oscillospiraceae bacterium]